MDVAWSWSSIDRRDCYSEKSAGERLDDLAAVDGMNISILYSKVSRIEMAAS